MECFKSLCGDGIKGDDEECDDGNTTDGDGCTSECKVEEGYECRGAPSTCYSENCGDGVVVGQEGCDDGNTTDGDGCSAACQTEMGYACTQEPSVCTAAAGQTCEDAPLIEPGVIQAETLGFENTYPVYAGACGNNDNVQGPDRVYRMNVPAHKVLEVEIETLDESLRYVKAWISDDCDDLINQCLHANGERFSWHNGADEERSVFIVVAGWEAEYEGAFQLTTRFVDPEPVDGATCDNPIVVNASGTYTGDTSNRINYYTGHGGDCIRTDEFGGPGFWGYSKGADEVYSVSLEPGQTLSASANPDSWDHVISIHNSCADLQHSCLVWADDFEIQTTNNSDQTQTYYVVVGGFHSYSTGAYSLSINIQ